MLQRFRVSPLLYHLIEPACLSRLERGSASAFNGPAGRRVTELHRLVYDSASPKSKKPSLDSAGLSFVWRA